MSGIDLRTINLVTGLMCVVMGTVILGMRRNFPSSIQGLGLWGLGALLGMLASAFYGAERLMPPSLAAIGGNALALTACGLMYFGTQRFYAQQVHWQRWAGVGAISLCGLTYFAVVHPDYQMRVALFTATLAGLFAAHARLLWRQGRGFAARFTLVVMGLQTLIFVARCVAAFWLDQASTHRFAASTIHNAYFVSFSFMVLLFLVGVLLMASERVRAEFEHMATFDSLTGALNRRVLLLAGDQELLRWQRHAHPFAVLLIDIDHFKQINDQHGHLVGDQVLKRLAAALRQPLRKTDLLARYGGEEFLVLLPVTDEATARELGERVRAAVQAMPSDPPGCPCTISVGVSGVHEGDTTFDQLVARADLALYQAKNAGRNRVVMMDNPTLPSHGRTP
ncbi:GGDEF domain-containing protein [Hydrogenophaga atypica]|uniref:diguanylate cyclase n=1 Tax=Hydrogenophaga atypica TaxID=249409 RepID=A0ABW2QMP6_9BURK